MCLGVLEGVGSANEDASLSGEGVGKGKTGSSPILLQLCIDTVPRGWLVGRGAHWALRKVYFLEGRGTSGRVFSSSVSSGLNSSLVS